MARQYANMQTQGPVQGQHCCCSCGIGIAFGVLQEETSRLRAELKARDEKVELTKKNDTADLKYRKRESLALQTENDRLHKTIKNQKNEIKRLLKKVADKEEKINKLQAYIEAQISRCEVYLKSTLDKNGSTIRELSEEICRLKTEGNRLDAQLKNMRALDSQQMKDAGLKTQRINQLMAQVDAKNAENDQLRLAIRGSVDMPAGRPTPWREQILKLEEEIRIQRQQIDKSYQVGAQMAGRDRKIDFFKWPEEEEVTGPQNCQLNKDDRFNPLLDTVSHLRKELKARDRYIKHLEEVNNTQARNLVWQANINPTQLLKSGQIQTFAQVQAETMALHRATVQRLQDTQTATDKLAEDKSMGREVHGKKTDQNRDDTDKSPDVQDKVTETQGKNMEVLAKVTEIQDMSAEPQWMARREKKESQAI